MRHKTTAATSPKATPSTSSTKTKIPSIAKKLPQANLILALTVCFLAALFYCYEYYLRVAPSIMSEDLKTYYHLSNAGLGILSAYYYYAYTPLQIPVGLLTDKFGPRRVLTFACLLCVIGTIAFAHASILLQAKFGRLLVGFGSAFGFVGMLKTCNSWLPTKLYAMMIGFGMLLGTFGAMAGEMIMAHLVQTVGWQKTLDSAMVFGIVLALLIWLILSDGPMTTASSSHTAATSATTKHQLWPALIKIMQTKQLWYAGIIGCLTYLPLSSFAEMWAVPYLEAAGYTKRLAAFGASMVFLGFGIGSPLWGGLSDLIRSRKLPLIIGSLLAAICTGLIIMYPAMPRVLAWCCLFGCGFCASAEMLVFAIGNDNAHNSISGTTASFINMVVMIGGIVLQPVTGKLLDLFKHIYPNVTANSLHFQYALTVLPIALLLAGILSILCKESYPHK